MTAVPVVDVFELSRQFQGHPPVDALRSVTFTVAAGERLAIMGHSGSGKSTLLNLLGLLDRPTAGQYRFCGEEVANVGARRADALRRQKIGFVFQAFHIIGHKSVYENLDLKLALSDVARTSRRDQIADAAAAVGLAHRLHLDGRYLSGGEKQRLAIARATLNRPALLLADEPTGNLDEKNTDLTLEALDRLADDGIAVLVITHDSRIGSWASRVRHLEEGVLL